MTHPFKQAIIPHLDALSDRATALGAVNTVLIQDGQAIGHNTDWCGFQRPLAAPATGGGEQPGWSSSAPAVRALQSPTPCSTWASST